MSYIVIPIFSDPFLHPLHKDNGLSLLYVKGSDGDSQMICQFHPDCVGVLEDYKWLEDKLIYLTSAGGSSSSGASGGRSSTTLRAHWRASWPKPK